MFYQAFYDAHTTYYLDNPPHKFDLELDYVTGADEIKAFLESPYGLYWARQFDHSSLFRFMIEHTLSKCAKP